MIEARIVETTKRFTRTLGIDWGFDGVADAAHGNTTGLVFPNNGDGQRRRQPADRRQQRLPRPARWATSSTPSPSTPASQAAESRGPDQRPLGAQGRDPEQPAGLDPERPADPGPDGRQQHRHRAVRQRHPAARRDAARHRRRHGPDGHQRPEARAAARLRGGRRHQRARSPPRKRSTRVIVRDGGTTVIGGIYKVSTDQGEDRVPGLANIPIIGHLFQNQPPQRRERRAPDLHHAAGDQALSPIEEPEHA